jgi:hypothetical protein
LWNELYVKGHLSSSVFSIYMAESSEQSTIEFGGLDTSYLKTASEITYLPLLGSSLFYVVSVDGWQVGSTASSSRYRGPTGYSMGYTSPAILDTGTTLLLAPEEVYNPLIKRIVKGTTAVKTRDGYYVDYCTNSGNYESFYMLMSGVWMEVPPESYLFNYYGNYCLVGIRSSGAHYWLLGDGFLKNFYTVWDNTNSLFGIGPHKTSTSAYLTTSDMSAPPAVFTKFTNIGSIMTELAEVAVRVGIKLLILRGAIWIVMEILDIVYGVNSVLGFTKDSIHTLFV